MGEKHQSVIVGQKSNQIDIHVRVDQTTHHNRHTQQRMARRDQREQSQRKHKHGQHIVFVVVEFLLNSVHNRRRLQFEISLQGRQTARSRRQSSTYFDQLNLPLHSTT